MFKTLFALVLGGAVLLPQSTFAGSLEDTLLQAVEKGDLQRTQQLLHSGASPNARDKDGVSALMLANHGGHNAILDLLFEKGAIVTLRNRDGYTALSYGYSEKFVTQFIARGGRATWSDSGNVNDGLEGEIWTDSDVEDAQVRADILRLARAGVNFNHRGSDEFLTTPLINVVQSRPNVVRLLLDSGADPNVADQDGETPLLHALKDSQYVLYPAALRNQVCLLLLERGAKVNVRGQWDDTVLMRALQFGNARLVQALLARGGDVNFASSGGRTALMQCADSGLVAFTRLLLERGARVNLQDKKGHTALDYAQNKVFVTDSFYAGESKDRNGDAQRQVEKAALGRQAVAALLISRGGKANVPFPEDSDHTAGEAGP